ncbi:MAG: class I SAM-dependent methyltransferase [Myxococcota bacterium]
MSAPVGNLNQEFYDRFWEDCPDFSRYNPGARHRRRLISRVVGALPGTSLLDVGCGVGELLMALKRRFPSFVTVAGADFSAETVRNNRARLPHTTFHVLDVAKEALPEQFDVVICSEVLEHIEQRASAVRNLAAMVAPGGHLLITCPTGRMYQTEKTFGHVSHPTEEELRRLGRDAGLVTAQAQTWGFPTYAALKWATNINAEWALKNFASGAYSRPARLVSEALYWVNFLNFPSHPAGCQLVVLLRRPVGT